VTSVLVPPARLERWVANFTDRHGPTTLTVEAGALTGAAQDDSTFRAVPPLERQHHGAADVAELAATALAAVPDDWGVVLVRKGGFAIARLSRTAVVASKVGQRHVQGRTKAGGQSQQRFARRRDNQARAAYEAAADHAARLLGDLAGPVVVGGDRGAVDEVLADARLARLAVVGTRLPVPDPRRGVLEQAVADALSVRVEVINADG